LLYSSLGYRVFIGMINTQVNGMLSKILAAATSNVMHIPPSLSPNQSSATNIPPVPSLHHHQHQHHPQVGDLHRRKTEPAIPVRANSTGQMSNGQPSSVTSPTQQTSTQIHLQARSPKQSIADIPDCDGASDSQGESDSETFQRIPEQTGGGVGATDGGGGPSSNGGSPTDSNSKDPETNEGQGCSIV